MLPLSIYEALALPSTNPNQACPVGEATEVIGPERVSLAISESTLVDHDEGVFVIQEGPASLDDLITQFPTPPSKISEELSAPRLSSVTISKLRIVSLPPPGYLRAGESAGVETVLHDGEPRPNEPAHTFLDSDSEISPTQPRLSQRPTITFAVSRRSPSPEASLKHATLLRNLRKKARRAGQAVKRCFNGLTGMNRRDDRKASLATISTVVSSIAEISDAISRMKWRVYFQRSEERDRERRARWAAW